MSFMLRNIMEDIVLSHLDDIISSLHCCKCEQCRLDIASYALNRLPAKYVVTTQGELLVKLDSLDTQIETSIISQITQAVLHVSQSPRHITDAVLK